MSIAKQLYQLQELEIALESNEQAQNRIVSQLGENQDILKAKARLASDQNKLEELNLQQKSADWEIEDLTAKIKEIEKKLYGGRISNSKELTNLQLEAEELKKIRSQLEDKVLGLMDEGELTRKTISDASRELAVLEARWQNQQKELTLELEKFKTNHTTLGANKQSVLPQIDSATLEIYKDIKKRKGIAVARVEQGICLGCRITLPNSDLQQARGNGLVKCSSCGRILFMV
jgi:predicted  nucleic acid-binding Zn-ribbon protein